MSTLRSRLLTFVLGAITAGLWIGGTAKGEEPDKKTVRTWKAKCASCHGADGKADTDKGKEQGIADMTADAWQKQFTDAQLKDATAKGLKRDKNGKKQEMDGFAEKLKDDEIAKLVTYMRGLKK